MSLSFPICETGLGPPARTLTRPPLEEELGSCGGEWRRPAPTPFSSPGPRRRPAERKVSVHVTAPPPQLAPALRSPTATSSSSLPGPSSTPRRLRQAAGPGHSPASGPSRGFGLGRRRGGPAKKAPPPQAQQGPIGARCDKLWTRPQGAHPPIKRSGLAGGANQKLPECASRGKRTALERGARGHGSRQDLKPDRQGSDQWRGTRGGQGREAQGPG